MNKESVLEKLGHIGLVPVAVIDTVAHAVPLADAIKAGGIDTAEITLRTDCALESIAMIKEKHPDFLVGAGTVLNTEQAEKAIKAGADYIVSPGLSAEMLRMQNDIPVIPGCTTATEVQAAVNAGIRTVKFFPANTNGGVSACMSLSAPFSQVKFIPTGGISLSNMGDYARCTNVAAIGGGWLCTSSDIQSENWSGITRTVQESVKKLLEFEVVHVGINTKEKDEGRDISHALSKVFGFSVREGELSNFVGTGIEVNNFVGLGEKGHIAVDTNRVAWAEHHLRRIGVKFREDSRVMANGITMVVYLQEEFGGFAIHLRQRNK